MFLLVSTWALFEVKNQALRFLVTFCLQKVTKEKTVSKD